MRTSAKGADTATMLTRMRSLLNHTHTTLPAATMFLASILNMPDKYMDCVTSFNKALPGIVKEFQTKGMQIAYVPMNEKAPLCGDHDRYIKIASSFT
jgi:hypothetical protein